MNRHVKAFLGKATAIVLATAVMSQPVWAVSITGFDTAFTTNLNGWNGTLPAGFTRSGGSYIGTTASTTGGVYAIANSGFSYQPSSGVASVSLTGTFTNDTGSLIEGISLSYDAFQIVNRSSRTPGWSVTSSLGTVIALNWTFDSATSPASPATPTLTLTGLSIDPGATFTFTFASDRGAGSGSSPLIGLNNISLTAIGSSGGGGGSSNFYWVGDDTTLGGGGTWAGSSGTAWRTTDTDGTGEDWDSSRIATFGGASAGTVNVSGTVNADAGVSFATTGYTLSGGTLTLAGADASTNSISVSTDATAEIGSVLSGSAGMTKSGFGNLTLSGTNTFSGGTTVSAGTLSVSADAALGNSSGGITLGGGRLEMASGFTLDSGRTLTAAAGTTSAIAVTSGTVSFAGPFTGSGNLDKAGAGTLSVSNSSSGYSGTFTISAGTLEVTAANAFANATLSQTGGTLLLAPPGGGDVVIPDLGGSGGDVTIESGSNAVFSGNSNRSYNGRIRGQGAFKKEGNGILTLNSDNDFAGNTRIAQGQLKLGANGALSATPQIEVDSGAIFDVTDKSGFALGNGQRLGGRGTVLGDLQFASGSEIAFDPTGPMLVGSGTVSFAAGFGIGSIFGLTASVPEGTYTLLDETGGGSISFANLANVGSGLAFPLGGGKSAYFQSGSLQIVVVPEPQAFLLGGLGLALTGILLGRRRSSLRPQAA